MTIITSWCDFVERTLIQFPKTKRDVMLGHEGDIGALMHHVANAHDLTFAEAAEVVTFRLPQYLEPTALSA